MRSRHRAIVLFLAVFLLLFSGCTPASGSSTEGQLPIPDSDLAALDKAVLWMVGNHQNEDGGYASFSTGAGQAPSSIAGTLDAALAIAAARQVATPSLGSEGLAPLDFLEEHASELAAFAQENGGQAGKVVLTIAAFGVDPRDFAGHDFFNELAAHLQPSGAYGVEDPYKQSLAILGVAAAGQPIPTEAVGYLESLQSINGSWDDGFGVTDNTDATAMAIMALVASGRKAGDTSISLATDFLANSQEATGGWAYGPGLPVSANSTALAIQALITLGQDVRATSGRWAKGGQSPMQVLLGFQGESGAFQGDYGDGRFDDFYTTAQAIPAVSGQGFPFNAPDN